MKIQGPSDTDKVSPEEFIRVTRLSPEERFEYMLQEVIKHDRLWGLYGENGWVMVESDGDLCLPIWPHKDFVVSWERSDFPECEEKDISLHDFIEFWAPGLNTNNTLLLLFPCGEEEEGIVISAEEFSSCIKEAAEQ